VGWALLAVRHHVPMALSVIGANAALFTGFACTIPGLAGYADRPLRSWMVPGTGLSTLLVFTGLYAIAPASGGVRIVVAGVLAAAIASYAVWIIRANRPRFFDTTGTVLLGTFAAITVLSLARAIAAALGTTGVDFRNADLSQALVFGAFAVFTLLLGFAYMRLISLDVIARLERTAWYDPVSGASTRGLFENRLEVEIERARRFGSPLAVLLFDLDHFKAVNDTHGHTYGDRCLAAVVDRASTVVRRIDTLARFGGDEFAALLPGTDLDGAYRAAERLQQAVNDSYVAQQIGITLSLGVAEYRSGEDADTLLSRADRALYDAKHAGRDRVSVPRFDTDGALGRTGDATPE
jgi:diguanylate cyclase (GGDEF)-like protein